MEIKLLSCPLCATPHFEGVDALRTMLVGVATSFLKCPVCPESLMGLDKLTIHLFSHVVDTTKETSNSSCNLQEHVQNEIDKSIHRISESCTVETRTSHVEKTTTQPAEEMKCDICHFTFTDKNILEMHQKLLHQTSPDKKTGTYSYHCHLCSKKFKMRGSLMVHLRVAHYGFGQGNIPSSGISSNSDNTVMGVDETNSVVDVKSVQKSAQGKVTDNKHWECDICSKMFTTKYFLKKHKRLHTGEMPYCCSLCNKSFTFQQSYHKHMLYHSSEKPYVCNECGRAFKELSTLQNHARIHSGERPFCCETCGKSFRQRVSYLVHRRIHTGVMPYKCTACDKSFRYKVSQRSHKCPANPPGSVVRIMEQQTTESVLGGIEDEINLRVTSSMSPVLGGLQKKSIPLNDNEHIEISFKKADFQLAMDQVDVNGPCEAKDKLEYTESVKDLFSMVLSPILPEVESLCLSNSPLAHEPQEIVNDAVPEKCLNNLFHGSSQ